MRICAKLHITLQKSVIDDKKSKQKFIQAKTSSTFFGLRDLLGDKNKTKDETPFVIDDDGNGGCGTGYCAGCTRDDFAG